MLDFLIEAHEAGENLFEGRLNTHADWILIHLLLRNESLGRATVAKHVMENVPCAPGTVARDAQALLGSWLYLHAAIYRALRAFSAHGKTAPFHDALVG